MSNRDRLIQTQDMFTATGIVLLYKTIQYTFTLEILFTKAHEGADHLSC